MINTKRTIEVMRKEMVSVNILILKHIKKLIILFKTEGPQDLSCTKEEAESKMEIDSDSDESVDDHVSDGHKQQQSQQSTNSDSQRSASVRPQIIVTPRKVAAAIESVTAAVLAENNKNTLSECITSETPLNFLPTSFSVFDINSGASTSSAGEGSSSSVIAQGSSSGSPSKSVIVRAGPSVSSFFFVFTILCGCLDTELFIKHIYLVLT